MTNCLYTVSATGHSDFFALYLFLFRHITHVVNIHVQKWRHEVKCYFSFTLQMGLFPEYLLNLLSVLMLQQSLSCIHFTWLKCILVWFCSLFMVSILLKVAVYVALKLEKVFYDWFGLYGPQFFCCCNLNVFSHLQRLERWLEWLWTSCSEHLLICCDSRKQPQFVPLKQMDTSSRRSLWLPLLLANRKLRLQFREAAKVGQYKVWNKMLLCLQHLFLSSQIQKKRDKANHVLALLLNLDI